MLYMFLDPAHHNQTCNQMSVFRNYLKLYKGKTNSHTHVAIDDWPSLHRRAVDIYIYSLK